MFWVRFRSSIMLIVITLFTVILGGDLLFAVTCLISFIGLTELYKLLKVNNSIVGYIGYLACAAYYALIYFKEKEHFMLLVIAFMLVLMIAYVFAFPKYRSEQICLTYFGLFYVAVMLSHIYQVRMLDDGLWLVWLLFIGAWGSDTCAYLVGISIGKHKMTPKLSPKKSIEGGIGGILGAALIGFIYGLAIQSKISSIDNPQIAFAIICGASSIVSQIGDLAASAMKRNYEIKDYGKLIPGHGGILDRFDSIIFTAPIVYYLAVFLGN
ncbi:phosphatidate cytidylyltransferase [Anaerosporobacter faecicola]|uniref:phosphatidate cytidylyltransferase n=1 Tax=Anaerosporobacter faecicola TaxID=2718714 RepID=UPI00143A66CD|nr:phosphatidate cytidylyltransferase [Anaerosporobacter faecicola]